MNGFLAPLLIGTAVGTFFTGSPFIVNKNAVGNLGAPVISRWMGEWGGLEAVGVPFNLGMGLMVMMLAISLGALYLINNIEHESLNTILRERLKRTFTSFLCMFAITMLLLSKMSGFAVDGEGTIYMQEGKYLQNLLEMPAVLALFVTGALLVVTGIVLTLAKKNFKRGIWLSGPGTVFVVMALFMIAGYNGTAYYPSNADLQSSLTLSNSCSSEFTLKTMAIVSLIIPFVVAYIAYFWRKMDLPSLTKEELDHAEKY